MGDAQRLTVAAAEEAVAVTEDDVATDAALTAFAPMPPAAKPMREKVAPAEPPAVDPAVAVALAEAETVSVSNEPAAGNDETAAAASGREREDLFASGSASARISSAWRATQAETPFQALFRTGETDADARFDDTFVSAFRARPAGLQAAVEAHAGSNAASNAAVGGSEATTRVASAANAATTSDGRPFESDRLPEVPDLQGAGRSRPARLTGSCPFDAGPRAPSPFALYDVIYGRYQSASFLRTW